MKTKQKREYKRVAMMLLLMLLTATTTWADLTVKPVIGGTVAVNGSEVTATPNNGYYVNRVYWYATDPDLGGELNPVECYPDGMGHYTAPQSDGFIVVIFHCYSDYNGVLVRFNMKGHGTAIADRNQTLGQTVERPTPDPTEYGYGFRGWYTNSSCTKAYDFDFVLDNTLSYDSYNDRYYLTLYAKWEEVTQYNVTLDLNYEGAAPSSPILVSTIQYTPESPIRDGYTFLGWATSPTGSVEYAPGATITLTGDLTLYAIWDQYHITLDLNYEGAAPSSPILATTIHYTPASPTRDGYTFLGWATSPTGSVVYAPGATITLTGDLILYAKWGLSINGFKYEIISESLRTVKLTNYDGDKPTGTLEIPASTTIGGNAFTVTSIGKSAFLGCTGLTSITIPASVTSIGDKGFSHCSGLTSLTFAAGSSLSNIGNESFFNCTNLTSVTIPASVTSIGERAFNSCYGLTSLTFAAGSSLSNIGKASFESCTNLTSVTIPASVTSIGERAFQKCTNLTSVTIPASVTSIGMDAFQKCTNLTSVTVYATAVPAIGQLPFSINLELYIYVFTDLLKIYSETQWRKYNLVPISGLAVSGVTANKNPDKTTDNWCTYYHPCANVKINTAGVKIFKASLSGSSLTLTEVDGNVIKAGQAVILKAPAEGALDMELTSSEATGDFSGNELKGTTEALSGAAGNIYVLNYTAANGVGFYKLNTTGSISANKAYLTYEGTSSSNFFVLEDETTSIELKNSKNGQLNNLQFDNWYDLSGRRIVNGQKPTAKGIYIHNGKLEVLK